MDDAADVIARLKLGRMLQSLASQLSDPGDFAEPSGFPDDHQLSDATLLRREEERGGSFGLWLCDHPEITPKQSPAVLAIARIRQFREELHDAAEIARTLSSGDTIADVETAVAMALDLQGQMDVPALWALMDGDPNEAVRIVLNAADQIAESCMQPFRQLGARLLVESAHIQSMPQPVSKGGSTDDESTVITETAETVSQNDERDAWIYERVCRGDAAKDILKDFKPIAIEKGWGIVSDWSSLTAATDRYAKRKKLPPRPKRKTNFVSKNTGKRSPNG